MPRKTEMPEDMRRTRVDDLAEQRYREMMRSPVTVAGKEYPSAVEAHMAYSRNFTPGSDQARRLSNDAWAALRRDARNAVLLDEYNRQSEANRPASGNQEAYDALVEKGRAKYAGGAFANALTSYGSVKQDIPKADTSYKGPTYEETHRRPVQLARPKRRDELDEIADLPVGRPVGAFLESGDDVITVGGRRRKATKEERSTRENPKDYGAEVRYKVIDPFGVTQASKAGDAGSSRSSGVPKGHNPALDGYSGPRIVINPSTFRNEKDGLCVAFDEAFRILMEVNGFDPVAEPTEKQREFFSDTAYADDERMLRRTILARICTFDTSVTDPTDEQLQEAVEFLDTVLEIGAPQNQWEQRAVERIRAAIEKSVGQPRAKEEAPEPPAEGPSVAAAGGGETEEEALKRLADGDTGKTLQEDTSTLEERERFLEERGMDKSLAETGSMDTLVKMHEQQNGVPPAGAAQTQPDAPATDTNTEGRPAPTNADILASKDAVEFVAANGGGTTGNGISVDAGAKVMDDGRIVGADGNARNADGKIDNFGRKIRAEVQQQAEPGQEQPQQTQPQNASERIGTSSGVTGIGGRKLTAGEAAWQARRQASTEAWMRRTGRSGDGVADALAQRDDRANGLRQTAQVDSGRKDALGRKLDDWGRVIA